jgi:large subunit ribosomal protein L29
MDQAEIKQLSTSDLQTRVQDEKTVLLKLKLNHAVSPIENPQKIKFARKLVARLQTELSSRALAEAK